MARGWRHKRKKGGKLHKARFPCSSAVGAGLEYHVTSTSSTLCTRYNNINISLIFKPFYEYSIISFYICHPNFHETPYYPKATYVHMYTGRVYLKEKKRKKNCSYNIIELQANSIIISSKPENQNLLGHAFYCLIHFPLTGQFGQQKTHPDRPRLPVKSLPDG